MKLEDYLKQEFPGRPSKGMIGHESDWLDFYALQLPSGEVHIVDPTHANCKEEGCLLSLEAGHYELNIKVLAFRYDRRVSRLRLMASGASPTLGRKVGEVGTDVATIGVYDVEAISAASAENEEGLRSKVEAVMAEEGMHGVVKLNDSARAVMCMVGSGFGDGAFPVRELLSKSKRVGFEVVFIESDEPYPFDVEEIDEEAQKDEARHWPLIENVWDDAWAALRQSPKAARQYMQRLTPGLRALLAIDIFNKDVLKLGGVEQFFRFQTGADVLADEVLAGYRLLGAIEYANRFQEAYSICRSVVESADAKSRWRVWKEVTSGHAGKRIEQIEDWFVNVMKNPDQRIGRFIRSYVEAHPQDFGVHV